MDIFAFRNQVVVAYEQYVCSFLHIPDERTRKLVDRQLTSGKRWPKLLILLDPAFAPGAIDDIVTDKVLEDRFRSRVYARRHGPSVHGNAAQ